MRHRLFLGTAKPTNLPAYSATHQCVPLAVLAPVCPWGHITPRSFPPPRHHARVGLQRLTRPVFSCFAGPGIAAGGGPAGPGSERFRGGVARKLDPSNLA